MLTKDELDALKELVELYPDTFFQNFHLQWKKKKSLRQTY